MGHPLLVAEQRGRMVPFFVIKTITFPGIQANFELHVKKSHIIRQMLHDLTGFLYVHCKVITL